MDRRTLLWFSFGAGALALFAIPLLDRPVAEAIAASGWESLWLFARGTEAFDLLSGKEISKFLLGGALTVAGLSSLAFARTRPLGGPLLFVGLVQLSSTLLAGVSKNLFGRLRPYELLESGAWDHQWFLDGSAFPSEHVGFHFGLFLPLAYLFPRQRWPLLVVPFFIAVARVNANDHFVSDVAVSMTLTALLTVGCATAMRRVLPTERPVAHCRGPGFRFSLTAQSRRAYHAGDGSDIAPVPTDGAGRG